MTINTKFNINDIVYFLHDGFIYRDKIASIKTSKVYYYSHYNVVYGFMKTNNEDDLFFKEEQEIFETIDELISFLKENKFIDLYGETQWK